MKNLKKDIKNYLKTVKFELKDFELTKTKRKNYKNNDYEAIKTSIFAINQYLDYLYDNVQYNLFSNQNYFLDTLQKDIKKSFLMWKINKKSIKMLKTLINSKTIETNQNFLENLLDYEDIKYAKNNKFTVRFYIENYKTINDTMHELLIDTVLQAIE